MKVALTHDYLKEYGGAERVLEVLHELFPDAPLYTAVYFPERLGKNAEKFKDWEIHTSWFQHFPFARRLYSPFRIFSPLMFESFNMSKYDLVISSSSAVYFAKAVITKPEALHVSYIHTPPRYLYGYTTAYDYKKNPILRFMVETANHFMRMMDYLVSQRPDVLVANSENIKARIKKFYKRDAYVIYPPIDLSEFKNVKRKVGEYYLSLARLDRGKRIDLVIKAFNETGLPLKVVGSGYEEEYLKSIAKENIEFIGHVSDPERVQILANAKALVLAAEDEDFGITAVEAQAAGTPVIALRAGGYKETVIDGKTGEFFEDPTAESLIKVLKKFDPKKYNESDCKKNAARFSKEIFKHEFKELIEKFAKEKNISYN